VSLRLHDRPDNREIPKDYTLQQQTVTSTNASHMTQNTYVFTEKDIPGAENRMATFGETRSALYEAMKRDARRREQGKRWEPYVRKTVPSMLRPQLIRVLLGLILTARRTHCPCRTGQPGIQLSSCRKRRVPNDLRKASPRGPQTEKRNDVHQTASWQDLARASCPSHGQRHLRCMC